MPVIAPSTRVPGMPLKLTPSTPVKPLPVIVTVLPGIPLVTVGTMFWGTFVVKPENVNWVSGPSCDGGVHFSGGGVRKVTQLWSTPPTGFIGVTWATLTPGGRSGPVIRAPAGSDGSVEATNFRTTSSLSPEILVSPRKSGGEELPWMNPWLCWVPN